MQFGAFWDQFQARGPALDVISGFSITATNYPEAVKTLRERFDRADLIIQHHIIQLAESVESDGQRSYQRSTDNSRDLLSVNSKGYAIRIE
ncbi:DNA-directed RNA polymerase subunit beta [Trichinella spiralis]|uniref:DNA-directed RNA polymerase subunit beta n=1 Tax=Trichinella spiralis TaxID=6334 RepID=A0ABR3K5X3_TRISP